jgi:hypothetical protein
VNCGILVHGLYCAEKTGKWTKHMKKCSSLLFIGKFKFKMSNHCTPVRIVIIKINNKCWGGSGERVTLEHCYWECKLV